MFSKTFQSAILSAPEGLVTPRKLDTALRFAHVNALRQTLKEEAFTALGTRCLLFHHSVEEILKASTDNQLWPLLLDHILTASAAWIDLDKQASKKATRTFTLVKDNIDLQFQCAVSSTVIHGNLLSDKFGSWNSRVSGSDHLLRNLLYWESLLGALVERSGGLEHRLRQKHVRENDSLLKSLTHFTSRQLTASWNRHVAMINFDNQTWLIPRQYILLMHNKVCDILSSLVLMQGASGVCYEPEAYDITVEVLQTLTTMAIAHKNQYHSIVQALEGLVIAEVLASEENWENTDLRDSISRELQESGFHYIDSPLETLLKTASTPLKHELAGLMKVTGHPVVDIGLTAASAHQRANRPVSINYYAIQMTRNIALQMFIKSYIAKHGEWPSVSLDVETPRGLLEAHRLGKDPDSQFIKRRYGKITPEMFVYVEIGHIKEFDKLTHYTQYLRDKALSTLKDQAILVYLNKEFTRSNWKDTRLLLVHMLHSEEEMDLAGYLDSYMQSGYDMEYVLNYLAIKLVPKEKELKIAGRPFGCKTYQDRYRSCVQEENVKGFLDRYNTDQSMTLDNLSLIKRLYSFRKLKDVYKGWRVLYINFDVSGWCGNFRHETVEPVCRDLLDAYFGQRSFFSKTQSAYERGFFYLPDHAGTYHWSGQDGGIEGLNQYTWMQVYIPQMRYALKEFGLHFHVMAYGDDYKAALLIPPNQTGIDVAELKRRIVQVVADTARMEFGQRMKYFDSYGSEVYISFCKHASVKGVEMPQGVRKIQKCYGATNAFLPTLDEYVASAFSNAHSAAKTMTCTFPAYRVALFWTYHHLLDHWLAENLSDDALHSMALIPSCAGGLPILSLPNFHTRAENDHLPNYLQLLQFARQYRPGLFPNLSQGLSYEVLDASARESLLRDPYSLPIKRPPLPSGRLRREVMPALRPIVRNQELLMLLEAADDDWSDRIVSALFSGTTLHPRVFSSIYACTPKALIEEIVKRFETSASIRDILVMRKGPRYMIKTLRSVFRCEVDLQTWRFNRVTAQFDAGEHWKEVECPAEFADTLRSQWGKPVLGVTMPPMEHLIHIIPGSFGANDKFCRSHHFTFTVHPRVVSIRTRQDDHWALGEIRPFLGHSTRLGAEMPQVKILEDNPFLSKIKTLLDITSWVDKGDVDATGVLYKSNLPDLIAILLTQYYREDPRELMPFGAKRKSGTIQHHWRSPHYREHIMPNTLYNSYTWISGETNTHQVLRGTTDHFTLNFLQVLCHVFHQIQMELEFSDKVTVSDTVWAVTTDCSYCMAPINEQPIMLNPITFPPPRSGTLEGVEITQISRQILKEAAGELQARGFRNTISDETLSIAVAGLGIVQRLMDQTTSRAARISECLQVPLRTQSDQELLEVWVPGGSSTLVREREIRHIPIRCLAETFMMLIYHWSFKAGSKQDIRHIMYTIWVRNPRELPWFKALERIREAGRLGDLVLECERRSKVSPPVCFDNPLAASRYIGEVSILCGDAGMLPQRYIWLTYFEDEQLSTLLNNVCGQIKRVLIWRYLLPSLKEAIHYNMHDMVEMLICSMYYVALGTPSSSEDISEIMLQSGVSSCSFAGVVLEEPDQELLMEACEDTSHFIHAVYQKIRQFVPGSPWPITHDGFVSYADEIENTLSGEIAIGAMASITMTTLADCINRVRAEDLESPLVYQARLVDESSGELVFSKETWKIDKQQGFFCAGQDMTSVVLQPSPLIDQVLSSEEILLSCHEVYRIYGHGVSSLNKFLEVFACMQLALSSISAKNIMCLGEGYGGVLDMLAAVSSGSHFLFNTKPDSERHGAYPSLADASLKANNHTLDTGLVNSSVYDLTVESTARAIIENDPLKYHLVTCDAEADWTDHQAYSCMLNNVVTIYLSKRSSGGLLVMKVMIDCVRLCSQIMSRLGLYCHQVGLVRPKGSPPGGETYMIARGVRKVYCTEDVVNTEHPLVQRLISTFSASLKGAHTAMTPPAEIVVSLARPTEFRYFSTLRNILPPHFLQLLTGRYGLPVDLVLEDLEPSGDRSKRIYAELRRVREQSQYEFERLTDCTAATVVHASCRLLYCSSLEVHFKRIELSKKVKIFQSDVRNEYLDTLDLLDPRFRVGDEELFCKSVTIYGVVCSPFGMWMAGLNTVLAFWGWKHM